MNNVIKGDIYEKFIRNYIDKFDYVSHVWLWKDVPEQKLFDTGLIIDYNKNRLNRLKSKSNNENISKDIGIDIIQLNINGEFIYIQCKNYTHSLRIDHLAGFYMRMAQHIHTKGIVYHSTNKLSNNIKDYNMCKRIQFIHVPHISSQLGIKTNIAKNTIVAPKIITPYPYQLEIIEKIRKYYIKNKKGILELPCATGKTLISCYVGKNYKHLILISPLKQFAEQNRQRYKEYDPDRKGLLIDSDGTRDIDTIKKFIKSNKSLIFSATYKSCDIILQILKYLKDPFIIIDEFHNFSRNNIYGGKDDPIYNIINSKYKQLYMSATPRIYELEGTNDCDVENTLGKTIYKMDFSYAIKQKYICDYNIILPINDTNDFNFVIDEICKELDVKNIDTELSKKCCYLYECIKRYGTLKCIIYFQSHKHIERFTECFNKLNKYYGYDYYIDKITCDVSKNDRKNRLDEFKSFDGIALLCSVQILDECIDIPECNSIYVTYNCKSKVKNIQRMCRAMRIDKNHKNKKARIILWCNEFDDILEHMSSIKEFDLDFHKKIKYIKCSNKFYSKKENEIENEIYNKKYKKYIIDVKEYRVYKWEQLKDLLFEYSNDNDKIPTRKIKYKNKNIGHWLQRQKNKINYNTDDIYIKLSENKYVKQSLDKYLNPEKKWNEWKDLLFKYSNKHKRIPTNKIRYKNRNIGKWLHNQKKKMKSNTDNIYILN